MIGIGEKKKDKASTSDSSVVHSQVDELTKLVKSLSTEIEKLKSEGKQTSKMLKTMITEVTTRDQITLPKSFLEILEIEREMIRGYKLLCKIIWWLMKKKRR
jgi:hypothetical protein